MMINDDEYKKWLKFTKELINKYNLKKLAIEVKEMHPFSKSKNKIITKNMVNIKIKDVHEIVMDNCIYDIL